MPTISHTKQVDVDMGHRLEDMIHDLVQYGFQQAHAPLYDKIENDSKMALYSRCTTFTRWSVVLTLVKLKAWFGEELSENQRFEVLGMEENMEEALAAQQLWFREYL